MKPSQGYNYEKILITPVYPESDLFKARPYGTSIPTKWMKVTLSSTLSIITKNTFHGLPYVTKYVLFKPKIGTLFNFVSFFVRFYGIYTLEYHL